MHAINATSKDIRRGTVLEITVSNHPGVMVHVCSLFSRRAYNMEGILCMPVGDGSESRLWLLVNEDQRLEQVEKQLLKLEDVRHIRRHGTTHNVFVRLEEFWEPLKIPKKQNSPQRRKERKGISR